MMENQGKFKRKDPHSRREELIAAGIRCLNDGGISNFTIDSICKQAGVSRGLINHYFKSKDDLLVCIYDSMTDYLVCVNESQNAEQRLKAFILESFDGDSFQKSNLRAWLAIWGEVATHKPLKQLHESRYRVYHGNLSKLIAEIGQRRGRDIDSTGIARQLIALIDGLWLEYCLHSNSFSLETASRDCFDFLQIHLGRFDTETDENAGAGE